MDLIYTEENIRETFYTIIRKQQGEIADFHVNHPVVGTFSDLMIGSRSAIGCICDMDDEGILVVLMHSLDVKKAWAYKYFKFSVMQGIRVKKGSFNYIITIQFLDGARYRLQMAKRSTRQLPNQRTNMEYMVSKLQEQGIVDMHRNENYKNKRTEERKNAVCYVVTLLIFFIPATVVLVRTPTSSIIALVCLLVVFIIHFILYSRISDALFRRKNDREKE